MRKVGISMLTSSMVLAKPIYHAGKLLLKVGSNNIDRFRSELIKTGISFVYIEDENSEGIEIPDAISEDVRTESKLKLREIFQAYEKRSILNVAALSSIVKALIDEIYYSREGSISLSDISSAEDALVRHSINTTVYAALIGRDLEYDRAMLQKLIYGSLLHDVGVINLNPRLFMKHGPWDAKEQKEYLTHTNLGYDALKKINDITELSKIIALSHHERLDGSGYPDKKKGDGIHELVRIVSIADEFDDLVLGTGQSRGEKHTVNSAMEKLMLDSTDKLDAALNAHLMKKIAVYPNGCMVKLSNNCYGLVSQQSPDMPYRPSVRLITDEAGQPIKHKEVNLVSELSLTIVESEMEARLTTAG